MPSVHVHWLDKFAPKTETEWTIRERRIWRQVCRLPLHHMDQFQSHRASNPPSVQTNTSPLIRPCNSTHWRPDPGRLKTRSPPHKCTHKFNSHKLQISADVHKHTHTQPPSLKRKSQKYSPVIFRVHTCFDLLLSVFKTKQFLDKNHLQGWGLWSDPAVLPFPTTVKPPAWCAA